MTDEPKKGRLLIIDDERDLLDVLYQQFHLKEFNVRVADSGDKGIHLLQDVSVYKDSWKLSLSNLIVTIDGVPTLKSNAKTVLFPEYLIMRADANVLLVFLMTKVCVIHAFSKDVLIVTLGAHVIFVTSF